MKSKVVIAGAVVTIVIVCLVALAAITAALQGPAKTTQGTCSVNGYVIDTYGTGISGTEVTLYIVGNNGSEVYNMTTPTSGSQPYVGLYVFDSVVITPDALYGYVSTSIQDNSITYYGRSDNFTLQDNATINKSIVMHLPPGSMAPEQVSQPAPNETSISGYVVNSYGSGLPGVVVTLHMMGDDGSIELYNTTTVTNSTAPSTGQYTFTNVIPAGGTQFVYMTASVHAGDIGIYGRSNNYTLSDAFAKSDFIVLHIPPECLNATLSSP
jgi:hypothetical protein